MDMMTRYGESCGQDSQGEGWRYSPLRPGRLWQHVQGWQVRIVSSVRIFFLYIILWKSRNLEVPYFIQNAPVFRAQ
jgi:hypothetical protein